MLFITFFGKFKGDEEKAHHIHESPWVMLLPLLVLAFLSVFVDWLNALEYLPGFASEYLHHWLSPMLLTQEHGIVIDHSTELMMNVGTVLAVVIVGIISYVVYALRGSTPVADSNQAGLTKLIANKFYVDEIYDFIIVRPIEVLSTWLHKYFDMEVLDGLVNGVGKFVVFSGSQIRKIQNGNTEYYLVFMVLGAIVLLFFGLVI